MEALTARLAEARELAEGRTCATCKFAGVMEMQIGPFAPWCNLLNVARPLYVRERPFGCAGWQAGEKETT